VIIAPDKSWVFISTPKCASHTLYDVLQRVYKGEKAEGGAYHRRDKSNKMTDEQWASAQLYTCVRDPWSRAVGAWGRMVDPRLSDDPNPKGLPDSKGVLRGTPIDFPEFVKWMISTPQTRPIYQPCSEWLAPVIHRVHAWHLETLDEDMRASGFDKHDKLPCLWSAEERGIPRRRNDAHWWGMVDEETQAAFREWAAEDIRRFGY